MMYVRFPLRLRNVEYLLFERAIDICHEAVRLWRSRFGPMFAADIRRQRVSRMKGFRQWMWHLDEGFVKIIGKRRHLVDRQTYKLRRSAALAGSFKPLALSAHDVASDRCRWQDVQ